VKNPFENGHIKNYILLYVSIVVIMVLFFIATTLFNGDKTHIEKRVFSTELTASQKEEKTEKEQSVHTTKPTFKLMKEAY